MLQVAFLSALKLWQTCHLAVLNGRYCRLDQITAHCIKSSVGLLTLLSLRMMLREYLSLLRDPRIILCISSLFPAFRWFWYLWSLWKRSHWCYWASRQTTKRRYHTECSGIVLIIDVNGNELLMVASNLNEAGFNLKQKKDPRSSYAGGFCWSARY